MVKVENTDDKGTSTGYVLVDGPHYLLKIERTEGDDPGKVEFSEFDEEFDVEAPSRGRGRRPRASSSPGY